MTFKRYEDLLLSSNDINEFWKSNSDEFGRIIQNAFDKKLSCVKLRHNKFNDNNILNFTLLKCKEFGYNASIDFDEEFEFGQFYKINFILIKF